MVLFVIKVLWLKVWVDCESSVFAMVSDGAKYVTYEAFVLVATNIVVEVL